MVESHSWWLARIKRDRKHLWTRSGTHRQPRSSTRHAGHGGDPSSARLLADLFGHPTASIQKVKLTHYRILRAISKGTYVNSTPLSALDVQLLGGDSSGLRWTLWRVRIGSEVLTARHHAGFWQHWRSTFRAPVNLHKRDESCRRIRYSHGFSRNLRQVAAPSGHDGNAGSTSSRCRLLDMASPKTPACPSSIAMRRWDYCARAFPRKRYLVPDEIAIVVCLPSRARHAADGSCVLAAYSILLDIWRMCPAWDRCCSG